MSRKLYKTYEDEQIQKDLYPRVLSVIGRAKKAHDIKIFAIWSTLAVTFSPVSFILLSTLHKKLIESSTFEYVSLLVNDAEARSLYTHDILRAVYDTIPFVGASLTLVSLVLLVVFYYKAMKGFSLIAFTKIPAY